MGSSGGELRFTNKYVFLSFKILCFQKVRALLMVDIIGL
jgi:hypothetical protein